jgi:hypothetical protein
MDVAKSSDKLGHPESSLLVQGIYEKKTTGIRSFIRLLKTVAYHVVEVPRSALVLKNRIHSLITAS